MKKILLSVVILALALWVIPASANIINDPNYLTLNVPNTALQPYPGPYATVGVSLDDATHIATFTFTAEPGFLFLDGEALDLNLAGTFTAPNSFNTTNISGGTATLTKQTAGTVDGFGTFNLRYTSGSSGPADRFYSAVFSVTGDSTWTTLASIFAPNAEGYPAAAHIGVFGTGDPAGTLRATGFAAVPLPPSAILMGSGLLGLLGLGWRKARS